MGLIKDPYALDISHLSDLVATEFCPAPVSLFWFPSQQAGKTVVQSSGHGSEVSIGLLCFVAFLQRIYFGSNHTVYAVKVRPSLRLADLDRGESCAACIAFADYD
jgi:hypothetical protein